MKRRTRKNPLIALLTDFGTMDGFVGTMKGIIVGINPRVTIVDIAHDIPPQDVERAAYVLWSSYRYFPADTIFAAVVDPGVGSSRKILCAEGRNHIFLAPDNGILRYIASEGELKKMWEVTSRKHFLPHLSSTFHGRDIFAPAAAYLSLGLKPEKLGKRFPVLSPTREFIELRSGNRAPVAGRVIYIDRFGNLITNFRVSPGMAMFSRRIKFTIKKRVIRCLSQSYASGSVMSPLALVNSSNLVEIGIRNANASKLLSAAIGDKVLIEFLN
ncbi:MAG: SAM-dependent chlorinase/fluorinase [Bacteroidota bacterium]